MYLYIVADLVWSLEERWWNDCEVQVKFLLIILFNIE
jgi:hypothetical protein